MPKIAYITKRFGSSSLEIIEQANQIIHEYAGQGFDLTLRQLYYQFIARDLLPNTQRSYKRLGGIISDARLAGLIDWDNLVDRTRSLRGNSHWDDANSIISSAAYSFKLDKWDDQGVYPEVWIEKDALVGVISDVCQRNDVNYFSCRGYTSSSAMWRAAQRLLSRQNQGKRVVIFHLGDHDPSGMDMSRDILDRLVLFESRLKLDRLALNMDQVDEYNPPPNPAKTTDSRAADYIAQYGHDSWELDALEPSMMAALIERNIHAVRDDAAWHETMAREKEIKRKLHAVADDWDDLTDHL
jgi:hypothetical protein